MNKHTKGPWSVTENSWEVSSVYDAAGDLVAQCRIHDSVTEDNQDELEPIKEANARLIAAAPDLLEALQDLLRAYEEPDSRLCCDGRDCGCMGSTVHQQAEHYARLAISKAKAEGRDNG